MTRGDAGHPPAPRWKLTGGDAETATAFLCVEAVGTDRDVVVSVHGALDTDSSHAVARQLFELLEQPIRAVRLDLGAVTFVDSAGIGVLAIVHRYAGRHSVELVLRGVPTIVRRVLEAAGMLDTFELEATDGAA